MKEEEKSESGSIDAGGAARRAVPTYFSLLVRSLVYHWRMNVAVALGVAAAAAVLTGALLVGDSMRGSLRGLALERLGRVDELLLADRFFRVELADELAAGAEFKQHFNAAVPAIVLTASLENTDATPSRRANRVNLFGCDERFWKLGAGWPERLPQRREIVLNRTVAEQLGAEPGDWIMLRLARPGEIPAESPLGRHDDTVDSHRLKVVDVVAAEGLGRFALRPSQQRPRNAYVSLDWLAERLDRPGRCNGILAAGRTAGVDPPPQSEGVLNRLLRPRLEDYGIRLAKTPRGYFNITSQRMLLDPAAEKELLESLSAMDVQPALTYLANSMAAGEKTLPYSTITAIDPVDRPPLGPFLKPDGKPIGPIGDGRIVLNSWAAEDLAAKPGDTIRVTYFEPESTHGDPAEKSVDLKLAAVAQLAGAADDRDLTPTVAGITDEESMADWDPPFPFDSKRIRDRDEQYWDDHGATPKAFVSLVTGRRLWSSRFGATTSLRVVPPEGATVEEFEKKLALDPAALGFAFQPLKRQALEASAGTTPFNVLFLSLSFFIIAAAVMLIALLFGLGIDRRAAELGTLLSLGWRHRSVTRLLLGEGLLTAAIGSLIGLPAGAAYAGLMLLGLRTLWLAAVVTPFLRLHVEWTSLLIGFAAAVAAAMAAVAWSIRRIGRVPPRRLLAGQTDDARLTPLGRSRYAGKIALVLLIVALLIGLLATRAGEQAQAGAFFGAGALVLTAVLIWTYSRLKSGATGPAVAAGRGNLLRMAASNAARNPGRGTLTIGLVASASFLIVAVSAFHLDPAGKTPRLESGDGGFALVAESDQPIYEPLDVMSEQRTTRGLSRFSRRENGTVPLMDQVIALRVKPGDDATCLNLYQPRQPRLLGVPEDLIDRGGFAWVGEPAWKRLNDDLGVDADGTPLVPVVIEKNTANYSLHLWKGVGETYDILDARGRTVRLKVVGLLAGSIFQGDLLIGEAALLKHFPEVDGYRFFLIETPPDQTNAVRAALERTWGDYGLAAETTGDRLAGLLAVQNTYLSTFQSLGGLGLLLGTFGLAAVQLRNVLERRGELALLRAAGFRRATLAWLVMLENGLLLAAGLGCGLVAALVAVLPHLIARTATIPFTTLTAILALVLAAGLLAGLTSVRAVLRAPLLAALRQEH